MTELFIYLDLWIEIIQMKMNRYHPLSYYLTEILDIKNNGRNILRWKKLIRKRNIPIIKDTGDWLITEKNFELLLKLEERCFRYTKEKVLPIGRSLEELNYPTEHSALGILQNILKKKMQRNMPFKEQRKL